MSWSLLILCLAAFAMVTVLVSSAVAAALPWFDRLARRVAPRHRARLWLGLAALPIAVGASAVLVSFLPAVGLGHDHCLTHGPHHPHLCPYHLETAPGMVLVAIAVLTAYRGLHVLIRLVRALRLDSLTSRSLVQASEPRGDVLVFESEEPRAFVLGVFRPRIHVSRGLIDLGGDVVESVLAHERAHIRRRDLAWRIVCPVLAAGHLPSVVATIRSRLATAQEMAADIEAAETLHHGRLGIAEALVTLARLARTSAPGLSFTQSARSDLEARVRALLEDRHAPTAWPARMLIAGGLVVPIAVGLAHDLIHHGLETLLGALS